MAQEKECRASQAAYMPATSATAGGSGAAEGEGAASSNRAAGINQDIGIGILLKNAVRFAYYGTSEREKQGDGGTVRPITVVKR